MKKFGFLFGVIFLCLFAVAGGVFGAEITYPVKSDSVINSGSPDSVQKCSVYGDIGSLDVNGGASYRYLAKLDLRDLTIGSQFTEAVFKIDRVSTTWDDDDGYVLYKLTGDWNSDSVTWNNQPSFSMANAVYPQKAANGIFEFNITDITKEWLNSPSSNFGIVIKKEIEDISLPDHKGSFACADYPASGAEEAPVLAVTSGTANSEITNPVITNPQSQGSQTQSQTSSVSSDAYKAIVKIKSFSLDEDGVLAEYSGGSGAIIDSSGIVLTNSHVVLEEDDFGAKKDSSYVVCLTEDANKEPDCSYIGKLIRYDKDLDIALLKISSMAGYSNKSVFPYLGLNMADVTKTSDEVTVLGYPSIGGGTVTITKGIISGKENKYGKEWIKTDAVISYGNSGGAALDSSGKIIGVPSKAHSDLLGSLGYVINVRSIKDWIDAYRNKGALESPLANRTAELAKKTLDLKNTNIFTSSVFSITKPGDWNFTHESEGSLYIDKQSDDEGGEIAIDTILLPYVVDSDMIEGVLKRAFAIAFLEAKASILKNETVMINNIKARKIVILLAGDQINYYFFNAGNKFVKISYGYGANDKDKVIVDGIINSITINNAGYFKENTEYANKDPKFNIKGGNGWVFLAKESKSSPLFIGYKPSKLAFADMDIIKADDNIKGLNNEQLLKVKIDALKGVNSSILDIKAEIVKSDAHYKLNNEFRDVVMFDYVVKSISTGGALSQNRVYYIKAGDKYIIPSCNFHSSDVNSYNDLIKKFEIMLSSLSSNTTNTSNVVNNNPLKKVKNPSLHNRLKGKIVLKVESKGEAYYVHPSDQKIYYLGRPEDAFSVMRERGVGISNANLNKIPVGISALSGVDSDGDGLSDIFEDSVGTDKNKKDSDGDGFNDKEELKTGYNPKGAGKIKINDSFSSEKKGQIFLQVEGNGEAWYVNPNDGKRYFLGRPSDSFNVMRNLGLGISNNDFDGIN